MSKKIIILTASTGGGHDKAAENLKKLLESNGIEVQVSNFIREINRSLNYFVVNSYKQMSLKSPRAFGHLYYISNRKLVNKRFSSAINIVGKTRLSRHILTFKPDLIIGTHVLASSIICKLKEEGQINVPYISVVTDFHTHQSYIHDSVNAYIVGSAFTKNALIQNGICSNKIYNYGIPLTHEYMSTKEKTSEAFSILIMSGSIGLTFVDDLIKALEKFDENIKCTVVCGNNIKLKNNLEKKYSSSNKFKILGFTNSVASLMDDANVIITKPGGLTTSEAIAKELPLIIPFAMPGQEEENTEFLLGAGAAFKIKSPKDLLFIIEQLIKDPIYYEQLRTNVRYLKKDYSLDCTLDLINSFLPND